MAAIATVFGMLGAAVWLLGRSRGALYFLPARRGKRETRMEVVEKTRITPQHTLVLLRIGGRGLLVAVHPAGCTVLVSKPVADLLGRGEAR